MPIVEANERWIWSCFVSSIRWGLMVLLLKSFLNTLLEVMLRRSKLLLGQAVNLEG